jgi:epoxyqueuosine reductase
MRIQNTQECLSNEVAKIPEHSNMLSVAQLTHSLKTEAMRQGFALAGACPAVTPTGFQHFLQWLDAGYAGEMDYLGRRQHAYEHPDHVMSGTTSLLMLGMNYQTEIPQANLPTEASSGLGRIARYAWGTMDYHDLVHQRLRELIKYAKTLDATLELRGVVDTAPLLEREFAQLAGLGWLAKNTMLINRGNGSWFFTAALLLNRELEYDQPLTTNHCGTCTACLTACPTAAFPSPGVLDATRCISYLTIEHRGPIPLELRPGMGDWILGCDICQEVCPWNRKAPISDEIAFTPISGHNPIDLRALFSLTDETFRQRFRKTPLWRPKRRGMLRNAAIALGNNPSTANLAALELGLHDSEPLVRGACVWALRQHQCSAVDEMLRIRLTVETDETVRDEFL